MNPQLPSILLWVVTNGSSEEYEYIRDLVGQIQNIALPLHVLILSPSGWGSLLPPDREEISSEMRSHLEVLCDFGHSSDPIPHHWLKIESYHSLEGITGKIRERLPLRLRQELENQALSPWFIYSLKAPVFDKRISNWQRNPGRFDCLKEVMTSFSNIGLTERAKETEELSQLRQELLEKDLLIKRLHQAEERFRRFFEEDITGDVLLDRNWQIVDCNTSFVKIFRFPSKAFALGVSLRQVFIEEIIFQQVEKTIHMAKGIQNYEMDLWRQDGQKVNVIASFFLDERQDETYILGFLFDNTLRKSLEHQLRESQRMEGLGRLAGGVAHDFNNILTVINGYAELLLSESPVGTSQSRDLAMILEAGQKAAALTSQLLAFSRRQMRAPSNYNINQLILGMEGILRRLLKESINLNYDFEESLPNTLIDKAQFEQALMNLCLNAQDAILEKGEITIATRKLVLQSSVYDGKDLMLPGVYVELSVSDNGKGIPEDVLPHIFEPFYTTKEPGHGTGLGLATVYGIVQQNHAHINVESMVGQGSTFRIFFPANDAPGEEKSDKSEREILKGKNILLVEDDLMIREYITKILVRHGHVVQNFSRAEDLLNFYGVNKTRWDLLISDVVMPGMSGPEMVHRLKDMGTDIPVLFVSGYPDNELEKFGINIKGRHFIHKPFKTGEFLDQISNILR